MKRFLILGLVLAILLITLLPIVVSAQTSDCSEFPKGSCCREACCADVTYWYKVSYFENVWNEDIDMYTHVWTFQYVNAKNGDKAAEQLGLKAGYNCFVRRAFGYNST